MKKILLGLFLGIVIIVPVTAAADVVISYKTPHWWLYSTENYWVDEFTDNGNRCYVAATDTGGYYGKDGIAINCLKGQ